MKGEIRGNGEKDIPEGPYAKVRLSVDALDKYHYVGTMKIEYAIDSDIVIRDFGWTANNVMPRHATGAGGHTTVFERPEYSMRDSISDTKIADEIVRSYFIFPINRLLEEMKRIETDRIKDYAHYLKIPGERLENWERWWRVISELKG